MLKQAQTVLEGVLALDENSIIAMNELGKTFHLLGRHKQALDVLRQATRLSSQNIQRLCLIGEVELNLKDPESARTFFEKALEFDPDDAKAKAGLVVSGNLKEMLEAPNPMQVPQSFASILNTMGITMVRNQNFSKGIEQYRSALAFLHDGTDVGRVAFNLGLGYLRWGKPHEALPWFQKSETLVPKGFGKASSYIRQIVMSGASEIESNDEEQLATFGKMTPTAKPAGTVTDDQDDGGRVIPFPVPEGTVPTGKKQDDEILEEGVGNENQQVVLASIDAFDEEKAAISDETLVDEKLAI